MKKWIQKATARMKKKGTEGSFRKYCGGKVTMDCIQRGLNSPDPKIRAKARFAKAMMKIRKEEGGEIHESAWDAIDNLKAQYIDSLTNASLEELATGIVKAFGKNKGYEQIKNIAGELLTRSGTPKMQEGGTPPQTMHQQQMAPEQQGMPQGAATPQQPPQITYEEYVAFVMSYPEYFKQLLNDIEAAKQQVQQQGQMQEQGQGQEPMQLENPEMIEQGENISEAQ